MKYGPIEGEPTEWERMIWYLGERPRSFGLAIATADRLDALNTFRVTGAAKLADLGVRVSTLELVPGRSLVDQLHEADRDSGDVIFAVGLDQLLLDQLGRDLRRPEIEELNRARDRLPRLVHVPVVAWVTTAGARALARAARDLNDVVVTRYHFETPSNQQPLSETRDVAPAPGYYPEEAELLDARLAVEQLDTPAWLDLAERRATLALRAGDHDRAASLLDRVEAQRLAVGDVRGAALAAAQHAEIVLARGEVDKARAILSQRVVPALERAGDQREHAVALGRIADIEELTGNLDAALTIRLAHELPVYERLGERRLQAVTLGQIADIYFARGDFDTALSLRRRSLALYDAIGDERGAAITHGRIADICAARGELDEALRIRREIELPTFERLGDVRERAITLGKLADSLAARGDFSSALSMLGEALEVHEQLGDRRSRAVTEARIGRILAEQGHTDEALARLRNAISTFEQLGDVRAQATAQSYQALAQVQSATAEGLDKAITGYQTALHTLQRVGDRVVYGDVARGLQTAIGAREDIEIVRRLRSAVGSHGLVPEACELSWGLVITGGVAHPLATIGAMVGLSDRIFVRIDNRSSATAYVHVFDVGLRGRITHLNKNHSPSGIRIGPSESHTLGERPGGQLIGLSLSWPQGLTKDRSRLEELYAIATDVPRDLRALETGQLAARSAGEPLVEPLVEWLLGRDHEPVRPPTHFLIRRIEFELDPDREARYPPTQDPVRIR